MAPTCYRIVVKGQLGERFASAFEGMTVAPGTADTELVGELADQAQLYGILVRLRDLGIELVSVNAR